jgi:hypothetical protein
MKSTSTKQTVQSYWSESANEILKSATIINCEYMSKEECDNLSWHKSPLCLTLHRDGQFFTIIVSADDEQNDGGTLLVEFEETYAILPAIDSRYLNMPKE